LATHRVPPLDLDLRLRGLGGRQTGEEDGTRKYKSAIHEFSVGTRFFNITTAIFASVDDIPVSVRMLRQRQGGLPAALRARDARCTVVLLRCGNIPFEGLPQVLPSTIEAVCRLSS
jgi:hypothetical protein